MVGRATQIEYSTKLWLGRKGQGPNGHNCHPAAGSRYSEQISFEAVAPSGSSRSKAALIFVSIIPNGLGRPQGTGNRPGLGEQAGTTGSFGCRQRLAT